MQKHINADSLTRFCEEVLLKAGLKPADAQTVANVLVMTDTWGTFSHGTGALLNYVRAMRAGGIEASAAPELVGEGRSWAVIDGHAGMGMPSCCMAMNMAITKARTCAIAWVGVKNSSHFGAAGYYANMAAQEKMIGIAMSAADPNMVIPGARGHVIGNNPLAYAVPAGKKHPILLDIALSASAFGRIMGIKLQGQSLPPNWITDDDGLPATSLDNWPATGSMMPMAGHKGYGLAIFIEVMAGLLAGGTMLAEMKSWVNAPAEKANLGQAFIAIDPGAILPIQNFEQRVEEMIEQLHNAPKAKGSDRTYVPGEIEWEKRECSLKHGIPLPESIVTSLHRAGQECDIDPAMLHQ
jgi:LDH2 family malate/lactate/ureidoglycolate dehydrogenase